SIVFTPSSETSVAETVTASGNSPEAIAQLAATGVPCAPSGVRTLPAATVSDTRIEEACATLAANAYVIAAGGNVTFKAGQAVVLGNGFEVAASGRFAAF
ncbi:MAG: hypothetical protein OEM62_10255, partial [Acidobacteriota bacterium]|nr:hypothetical protein [Acidobacteriota bacterium]